MTAAVGSEGDDSAWEVVDEAVRQRLWEVLQTSTENFANPDLMGRLDPISLLPALARTARSVAGRPDRLIATMTRETTELIKASGSAVVRALGGSPAYDPKRPRDKRFADPTWSQNASYWLLRESYLAFERSLLSIVRDAETTEEIKRKAEFATQLFVDAVAPTNFFLGNPAVIKRAFESGGQSLARGARNFARDLISNGGSPRQVATGVHNVGQNMAGRPARSSSATS